MAKVQKAIELTNNVTQNLLIFDKISTYDKKTSLFFGLLYGFYVHLAIIKPMY